VSATSVRAILIRHGLPPVPQRDEPSWRDFLRRRGEHERRLRFLVHDSDAKFSGGLDQIFQSEGIVVIRTPIQAPNANAYAERWVGSVRREWLDRRLIFSRRQLEQVLHVYARRYNTHRPRRSLAFRPPEQPDTIPTPLRAPPHPQLIRRTYSAA
jgi:hypothetical protein